MESPRVKRQRRLAIYDALAEFVRALDRKAVLVVNNFHDDSAPQVVLIRDAVFEQQTDKLIERVQSILQMEVL